MAENLFVRRLLSESRSRLIGALMNMLEAEAFARLTAAQRKTVRDRVMSQVGVYHDMCLDILKASVDDGTTTLNEELLLALREFNINAGKIADGYVQRG